MKAIAIKDFKIQRTSLKFKMKVSLKNPKKKKS